MGRRRSRRGEMHTVIWRRAKIRRSKVKREFEKKLEEDRSRSAKENGVKFNTQINHHDVSRYPFGLATVLEPVRNWNYPSNKVFLSERAA